jgi:hypothetical protein
MYFSPYYCALNCRMVLREMRERVNISPEKHGNGEGLRAPSFIKHKTHLAVGFMQLNYNL